MYKIFGYYICEKMKVPDFLGIGRDAMVSVSSCFGGIHPDLSYCYFINDRSGERTAYRKKWNIDSHKAAMLQNDIGKIFGTGLAVDGRFLRLTDAVYFCETYFGQDKCMIVSVSTTEEYYDVLACDINSFLSGMTDENEWIGYDILGWDISGFHTFLCNHLHKELIHARFNDFCLLDNPFEEVREFARAIQGKGEPVEWIPCRIGGGSHEEGICCGHIGHGDLFDSFSGRGTHCK